MNCKKVTTRFILVALAFAMVASVLTVGGVAAEESNDTEYDFVEQPTTEEDVTTSAIKTDSATKYVRVNNGGQLELNERVNGGFSSGIVANWAADGRATAYWNGDGTPNRIDLHVAAEVNGIEVGVTYPPGVDASSGARYGWTKDKSTYYDDKVHFEYEGWEAGSIAALYDASQSATATYDFGGDDQWTISTYVHFA